MPPRAAALETRLTQIARQELRTAAKYAGFSKIDQDIAAFRKDPVWSHFGIDNPNFLKLRYIGNYYTSIFRKLGDMYQRFVEAIISHQLQLRPADLVYAFDIVIDDRRQRRSLDVALDPAKIADASIRTRVEKVMRKLAGDGKLHVAAIEVRCCYQIGDSKRIQADETAAVFARKQGLLPIMLIFCTTSLRSPVERLGRTWVLTEGNATHQLLEELTGFNLLRFMQSIRPVLREEMRAVQAVFQMPKI